MSDIARNDRAVERHDTARDLNQAGIHDDNLLHHILNVTGGMWEVDRESGTATVYDLDELIETVMQEAGQRISERIKAEKRSNPLFNTGLTHAARIAEQVVEP